MPKLWNATIDAHRNDVREAIISAAGELVAERGLRSVTISEIAAETGIGRATLYKYFSGVEAILVAWHERQIRRHLNHLVDVRDRSSDPSEQLEAVLEAFAAIRHESHGRHDAELVDSLHRNEHVARAELQLRDMVRDLLVSGVQSGQVRQDVAPDELASYCLHALGAARNAPSRAAVRRLVAVTLAGLRVCD